MKKLIFMIFGFLASTSIFADAAYMAHLNPFADLLTKSDQPGYYNQNPYIEISEYDVANNRISYRSSDANGRLQLFRVNEDGFWVQNSWNDWAIPIQMAYSTALKIRYIASNQSLDCTDGRTDKKATNIYLTLLYYKEKSSGVYGCSFSDAPPTQPK
jgi:hypothetical protein